MTAPPASPPVNTFKDIPDVLEQEPQLLQAMRGYILGQEIRDIPTPSPNDEVDDVSVIDFIAAGRDAAGNPAYAAAELAADAALLIAPAVLNPALRNANCAAFRSKMRGRTATIGNRFFDSVTAYGYIRRSVGDDENQRCLMGQAGTKDARDYAGRDTGVHLPAESRKWLDACWHFPSRTP